MTHSKNDLYELTCRGFSIVDRNFDVLETRMRERLIKERVHKYDTIRFYQNGRLRCESLVRDLINQSGGNLMITKQTRRLAINDRVRSRIDPRHVGVVQRFYAGGVAEVQWLPHGWIEHIFIEDLMEDKQS